jgi:hypothetical protein
VVVSVRVCGGNTCGRVSGCETEGTEKKERDEMFIPTESEKGRETHSQTQSEVGQGAREWIVDWQKAETDSGLQTSLRTILAQHAVVYKVQAEEHVVVEGVKPASRRAQGSVSVGVLVPSGRDEDAVAMLAGYKDAIENGAMTTLIQVR